MNSRQRILAALNGEPMDRVPICEIGVWPETEARWRREGLPQGISVEDYFGLDKISLFSYEPSLLLPNKIIEENNEYAVVSDGDGCIYKKWKNIQSPPQLLGATITSKEMWMNNRQRLIADISRFEEYGIDFVWGSPSVRKPKDTYTKAKADNTFTVISPMEPCWYFLRLMGEEESLCTIALDPDFAEQIVSDYTEFTISMLKVILSAGYRFDALWVFSDLCYKNGMLFSPSFYRSSVAPYQKRIFDFAKENGMKVIYHSDGNVKELIPMLIDVGVDCVQPLEARAGNDVRQCLETYEGKISCMGNINADVLASDRDKIYAEISSKVTVAKKSNRYIFHSDHSIPDTVSFSNYEYAIELAKEFGKY